MRWRMRRLSCVLEPTNQSSRLSGGGAGFDPTARDRNLSDPSQHSLEDQVVNRVERVPVHEAGETVGIEDRCLTQSCFRLVAVDLELQPDASWALHLGREPQEPILFEGLHPPEIERVSNRQPNGIPPSAAKTDAADHVVDEAAQPPE